ncbi:unnamed protein product, partial [Phaeothamnion confervicola]
PEHLWVLVHGIRGDPSDLQYMAEQIRSRHGSDAAMVVSAANAGPLATLDGIPKGGVRLFEEVMGELEKGRSLCYLSFVCHGTGGLYARYAVRLLDERGVLGARVEPLNFITLGAPHVGTLLGTGGVVGKVHQVFDMETSTQLRLADGRAGGNPPLLLKMAAPEYLRALARFRRRAAYANVRHDSAVEYCSAALRPRDPYALLPDREV